MENVTGEIGSFRKKVKLALHGETTNRAGLIVTIVDT
jgi:hypothetical protein